jgi:hypothetical protein
VAWSVPEVLSSCPLPCPGPVYYAHKEFLRLILTGVGPQRGCCQAGYLHTSTLIANYEDPAHGRQPSPGEARQLERHRKKRGGIHLLQVGSLPLPIDLLNGLKPLFEPCFELVIAGYR